MKIKYRIMNKINSWIGILWPIKICYLDYNLIIRFSGKNDGLFLYFKNILHFIISIIIFFIFYKYDIKLLPEEIIYYVKIYLKLSFIGFIIIILYYFISGFYVVKVLDKKSDNFSYGLLNTIKLINMLVNIAIVYWYFELTIELFLQYNIIFILNLLVTWLILFIKIILKKNVKFFKISSFLSYPVLSVIIIIMLIILKKSVIHGNWFLEDVGLIYEETE